MPRITISATILAGQSLSSAIDLSDGAAIFLHMPPAWTPALLTFLISPDGVTYNDAVDREAREVAINIRGGTSIRLSEDWTSAAAGYLKLRSGSSTRPIPQEASRTFVISAVT
jgi:hypothetical protein